MKVPQKPPLDDHLKTLAQHYLERCIPEKSEKEIFENFLLSFLESPLKQKVHAKAFLPKEIIHEVASFPKIKRPLTEAEKVIYHSFPASKAVRERFSLTEALLKEYTQEGASIGISLCAYEAGLGKKFLKTQDQVVVWPVSHCSLCEALQNLPSQRRLRAPYWMSADLIPPHTLDLFLYGGVGFFHPTREREQDLYQKIAQFLKPGGIFVTGFIVPPPSVNDQSEWNLEQIDLMGAKLQRFLFEVLYQYRPSHYRNSWDVKEDLLKMGFSSVDFYFDGGCVYPTVVARKGGDAS